MLINIRKLIADLLITFTRDNKFIELIRVLSSQAVDAYNEFNTSVPDFKYKAKANASVLSLQHHIKRELDVDVLITTLDGKPIDYLVTVHGFADEKKISQILDTYGLASRSYVFDNSAPFYSSSFINYACELSLIENKISLVVGTDQDFGVQSEFAVNSLISVVVKQISQGETIYMTVTIAIGETSEMRVLQFWEQNQIVSITPYGDDMYRYTFDDTIITNP